jgi:hypothetical protein
LQAFLQRLQTDGNPAVTHALAAFSHRAAVHRVCIGFRVATVVLVAFMATIMRCNQTAVAVSLGPMRSSAEARLVSPPQRRQDCMCLEHCGSIIVPVLIGSGSEQDSNGQLQARSRREELRFNPYSSQRQNSGFVQRPAAIWGRNRNGPCY